MADRRANRFGRLRAGILALAMLAPGVAAAEEIVVTQYGVTAGGWPFAVARAKGFFKEEGLDITGFVSSGGGGTSLRNLLASNVAYAEVSPGAAIAANLQGANLKIVSDNSLSVADIAWVVKPDSPLQSIADLKGRKLGYTNPRSTTQALSLFLLEAAKLKPSEVELVRTGGFGEGLVALDVGMVDATPVGEPLLSSLGEKYRVLARGEDVLPPLDNVVGVTTEARADQDGEKIAAIIRARRKAVKFMYEKPDEAADIIAVDWKVDPAVARKALQRLIAINVGGVPYFGEGQIHLGGLQRMVDVQKSLGSIQGDIDLTEIIDTRFLPEDLRQPAK